MLFYETFSKIVEEQTDFSHLRGYKNGPVFSNVWGGYTKDREEFEAANITRNPFLRTTRINCDKAFITCNTIYNDKSKTTARPDVSEDVFIDTENELQTDGYLIVKVLEDKLRVLNSLIQ